MSFKLTFDYIRLDQRMPFKGSDQQECSTSCMEKLHVITF